MDGEKRIDPRGVLRGIQAPGSLSVREEVGICCGKLSRELPLRLAAGQEAYADRSDEKKCSDRDAHGKKVRKKISNFISETSMTHGL